jgi:hypothetical protein
MSDPEERRVPDELELERETVADLDVQKSEGEQVRGGACCGAGANKAQSIAASAIKTV